MSPVDADSGEAAVVLDHSPLYCPSAGTANPRRFPVPHIAAPDLGRSGPGHRVVRGFLGLASYRQECSKQRLRKRRRMQSDSVGQPEFTCLPPERDTKLIAWACVVWLAGKFCCGALTPSLITKEVPYSTGPPTRSDK